MGTAMLALFLVFFTVQSTSAVIYKVNATEYNKMPALFALDDFNSCMLEEDATYCVLDADLFSRRNSSLMQFIRGYSEDTVKHFNHTKIHRGVCIKKTCENFINDAQNRTVDLNMTLERCINESIWKDYEIEVKLSEIQYCMRKADTITYDASDYVVAVVYIIIIVLNIIGTSYDLQCCRSGSQTGNPYLLAFSIRRNWSKLVAPAGRGAEPRLNRLKLFYGIRTMTMFCIVFAHTIISIIDSYIENPLYLEKSYDNPLMQLFFNGIVVTLTFFVMSSFLLAYNFQLQAEKHQISWIQFPRTVFLRWIKLTPMYALVLATICTWMRYLGDGPLWRLAVTSESLACRQYWWAHVFYFNNYVYEDSYCIPQSWYLAADTQLFCLGLLVCMIARTPRARKVLLSLLFVLSLVIPALHTYLQNLDAVVIHSPESSRNLYKYNDTFRLVYTRGDTNLSICVLGLIGGFLSYHWQTEKKDFTKYSKKLKWCVWLLLPLGVLLILSGVLFYVDGSTPSDGLRVTYATLYKPIFQIIILCIILSVIFKVENVYRGILEWRGFTWSGRVTYATYLCHSIFLRGLVGIQIVPTHINSYYIRSKLYLVNELRHRILDCYRSTEDNLNHIHAATLFLEPVPALTCFYSLILEERFEIVMLLATLFMSYGCGAILWLLVESPVEGVTKALTGGKRQSKDLENK